MQKLLFIILFCTVVVQRINAQFVTLPDPKFRAYLQNSNDFNQCLNQAGQLDTVCAGENTTFYMDLNGDFSNLDGIQYFDNVTNISCNSPSLVSLPKLPPKLAFIGITDTKLTSLPSLPSLPADMVYLECSNNKIKLLPTLPAKLEELLCNDNQISALPSIMGPGFIGTDSLIDFQMARIATR